MRSPETEWRHNLCVDAIIVGVVWIVAVISFLALSTPT